MGKRVSVNFFKGMELAKSPHLLANNESQDAENVDLRYGSLKPFPAGSLARTLTGTTTPIKSLYRFSFDPTDDDSGSFFNWNDVVDVVKGPVPGDTVEMTYFVGNGDPKFTDTSIATSGGGFSFPNNEFLLGIPVPSTAGSYAIAGTAPATEDLNVSRTYAVTYVGARGEEGPPAFSASLDVGPDESINITTLPTAPAGNYDIDRKRIYRTATGQGTTRFFLVAEVSIATASYSDTKTDSQLGIELVSTNHYPPPTGATSMVMLSNGIILIAKDNRLAPSEAYLPYAYNPLNEKVTDYPIIGLGSFKNTGVALTAASPWISVGSDPRSMNLVELKEWPGCASKRSVASSDDGVIYASKTGLILVGSQGVMNLSDQYMTIEEWRSFKPETMHSVIWRDRYLCTYDTGSTQGTLIFHLGKYKDLGFTKLTLAPDCWYADPANRILYYTIGTGLYEIADIGAAANYLAAKWVSGDMIDPKSNPFTAARVIADTYASGVTLKVYHDDVLVTTKTVTSDKPFRLPGKPSGSRTQKYKFELGIGSTFVPTTILQFDVAETVNDLYKET